MGGVDVLALAQAKLDKRSPGAPPQRFRVLKVADLAALPRMQWRVHSVLPTTGCGAVYGPSGSGKSFLVLDLAAVLGVGGEWFGHRVKPCRVLYIVLEGEAGFLRRIEAWERHNERGFPDAVQFIFQPLNLMNDGDVLGVAAAIDAAGGADVVIVDTYNRATPGADENSSRDTSLALEGITALQRLTGGLVLLVAHTGKDSTKGLRGHSSLLAALDSAVEVSRTADRREWTVFKSKDGGDGEAHPFRLQLVDLGSDEDGVSITSCVVQPDHAPVSQRPKPPKGGNQRIVYDLIGPLLRESRVFGVAGAPAMRPCVRLEDAIVRSRDRLPCETARRTERARQAIQGMVASGVLGCSGDWLWMY